LGENGERSSRSRKRTAVERTSVLVTTHRPSRGDPGSGDLCGGSSHVHRWMSRPVQAKRARGSASRSTARTTKEVRGTGSRRGLARRNDGASLHSDRSGPHERLLLRRQTQRGSSARAVPARGQTKARRGEGRHLPTLHEEPEQLAVGARASSYCRSRRNALGLREACHRSPTGRKPCGYTERVNGSLTIGSLRRVSAGAHRRQKGGVTAKLGDPHHVNAASSLKAAQFRLVLRERDVRRVHRRKAPWAGHAHAFHEAPAEPVLAAFEPVCGGRKKAPAQRRGGGDKGVRGDRDFDLHTAEENATA